MATYIPGIESYVPVYEPFEPDFKFAQAVLSTRQDRYDTNYKAINDLYGSVVYADLSRQDTQEMRDQFADKLVPRINQIAELDLSIGANVDQAQGVFNPFIENKLIQQDIFRTARYKGELQRAQSLLSAPNSDANNKYWQTGIDYLNYQMQDFIDAPAEEAGKKPLPTYIPNVNLYQMGLDYLKESGIEVEDFYFTKDKKFIIKQKNGELIYDASYERVRKALATNANVQRAYAADAYVKARKHAEEGVAAGKYGSVNEGRVAWAQNILSDITFKAAELELSQEGKVKELEDLRKRHEASIQKVGSDRVSPAQKRAYEDILLNLEEEKIKTESNKELIASIGTMTSDDEALLNKAYAMLMNWNISDDLRAAARSYSMEGASRTPMINEFQRDIEKHKLDMIRDAARRKFEEEQNALDRANELEAARIASGKLAEGSRISNALKQVTAGQQDVSFATDAEGKPLADYNALKQAETEFAEADTKIYSDQVSTLLDYYTTVEKNKGVKGTPESIVLPTKDGDKVFTIQEARTELQKADYKEWVQTEYKKANDALATPESRMRSLPDMSDTDAARLKNQMNTVSGLATRVERGRQELSKRAVANWEQVLKYENLPGVDVVLEDIKYGAPSIVQNGKLLSKDEFINLAIEKARKKQFIDKVRIDEPFYRDETQVVDYGMYASVEKTGEKFDEKWARESAEEAYKEQYNVLNRTLNGYFNGEVSKEAKTEAGAQKPFEAFGVYSVLRGGSIKTMNDENAFMSNSYNTGVIVPQNLNTLSPEQENVLVDFINQINTGGVQYLNGDARTYTQSEVEDNLEKNAETTRKVIAQALMDLDAGSQGSPQKNKGLFSVSYIDAYGASDSPTKTGAYVIKFDQDYLNKLATGDSEDPGYGILNRIQKNDFSTITLLVNEDEDVSGYSQNNYNYSDVDTQIQFEGKYQVEVPGAGTLKIWKDQGLYYSTIQQSMFDPKAETDDHYVYTTNTEIMRYPDRPEYGSLRGQPIKANAIQQVADHIQYIKMKEILDANEKAKELYNKTN